MENKKQKAAEFSPHFIVYDTKKKINKRFYVTGFEYVTSLCPDCDGESYLEFDTFAELIKDDRGVRILCDKCAAARSEENA
jgi:hypothetical protein